MTRGTTEAADRDQVLVDTDWVVQRLNDPELILIEVDDQPALYHRGHPPGARLVDWRSDLHDPVRRELPSAAAITTLWRQLGIGPESTVVCYGDLHNWLAAYAYWLFRAYGLPQVRLLDGGRQRWLAEDLPTTRQAPPSAPDRRPPAARLHLAWRAGRGDVADAARRGRLLDVRTPQEFTGQWLSEPEYPGEAAHRPGHIPGALNLPWDLAVDVNGLIKPTDTLHRLYQQAGIDLDTPLVTYCRIGERSAHTWIVLHEILGHPHVANYDGSWTEWGSMTGMPIQLGPETGTMPADFTG